MIADRAYDSYPLRERLKKRGIDLIVPYRTNRVQKRFEDGRKLRRYGLTLEARTAGVQRRDPTNIRLRRNRLPLGRGVMSSRLCR